MTTNNLTGLQQQPKNGCARAHQTVLERSKIREKVLEVGRIKLKKTSKYVFTAAD